MNGKAPAAPSVVDEQVESGREPPSGHKGPREVWGQEPELDSSDEEEDTRSLSTLSVQLKLVLDRFPAVTKESTQKRLQLYMVKHSQLLAARGQHVPKSESTEYIKLFTRIFKLELNEYIKCKLARGTATLTATLAESVDFAEAMWHNPPPGHHPDIPHLLMPTALFRRHYPAALSAPRFPETLALTPAISASTLIDPTQPQSPSLTLPDPMVPPPPSPGDHSGNHFRHPGQHPRTDH
ncbi:hypothetical protein C0992_004899 [Termitomyces sp. T32_za158]|nr:hypothetical protein C0992_004899 [Termitomyces sp. T32_za158]